MNQLSLIDAAGRAPGEVEQQKKQRRDLTPPVTAGQCAQVLNLIRQHQPLSFAQWLINALGLQGA